MPSRTQSKHPKRKLSDTEDALRPGSRKTTRRSPPTILPVPDESGFMDSQLPLSPFNAIMLAPPFTTSPPRFNPLAGGLNTFQEWIRNTYPRQNNKLKAASPHSQRAMRDEYIKYVQSYVTSTSTAIASSFAGATQGIAETACRRIRDATELVHSLPGN